MIGAMDVLTRWFEIAGIILAVPAAAVIVWGVIKLVGHFQGVHEAIIGRPATPYSEAVPSMIERFRSFDTRLDGVDTTLTSIDSQFHTNGGGTVKDDLKKVQAELGNVKTKLGALVDGQQVISTGIADAADRAK